MGESWNENIDHGNIILIIGPLWEESTNHCWILLAKASEVDNFNILFLIHLNKLLSKQ